MDSANLELPGDMLCLLVKELLRKTEEPEAIATRLE